MHYAPWLVIPRGLSTLCRCSLTTMAQRITIPWETIKQGLLQPQGELYPFQTIFNHRSRDQLLEFRTSFYETISSEFLVQGNFKHTQFSREHWNWPDSNSQPLAPKASAVSIELTWLLCQVMTNHKSVEITSFKMNLIVKNANWSFTHEKSIFLLKVTDKLKLRQTIFLIGGPVDNKFFFFFSFFS